MELKRIETPGIAHYAYLLAEGGEAAVVDPSRDVDDYLRAAREAGAHIKYVIETHRQEDFVMGSAYLARKTGAKIINGSHELFGHGDIRLEDGDTFDVGSLTLRALATPGHTPESMSYAVYSDQDDEHAWCVLTGDALFFGTTGRTDLPGEDESVANAALLYDSVHEKLADLGDTALVLPAHGPGSVCGSGMAQRPHSTIGEEKRYNEVFTLERDGFAAKKSGEQLSRPPYFRHMEKVNLAGGLDPAIRPGDVGLLDVAAFADTCRDKLVYDTREPEAFAGGHIEGSYSIWLGGLPVFGGWIGNDIETSGVIAPRELAEAPEAYQVLDVRELDEYAEGHIPGAQHAFVGHLPERLHQLALARDQPVVVTCSVGHRAGLGVSILLREGFQDVRNLLGGMTAWSKLGLPTE